MRQAELAALKPLCEARRYAEQRPEKPLVNAILTWIRIRGEPSTLHNPASLKKEATVLEDHVKSRSSRRRLRAGAAGPYVDAFVESLFAECYSPTTVEQTCHFLALLTVAALSG